MSFFHIRIVYQSSQNLYFVHGSILGCFFSRSLSKDHFSSVRGQTKMEKATIPQTSIPGISIAIPDALLLSYECWSPATIQQAWMAWKVECGDECHGLDDWASRNLFDRPKLRVGHRRVQLSLSCPAVKTMCRSSLCPSARSMTVSLAWRPENTHQDTGLKAISYLKSKTQIQRGQRADIILTCI